jgi:pilus assembly protein Flp/PilA
MEFMMITKLYITAQQALIDFKNDQRGVTAIEYAVLGVAVAAAVAAVFNGGTGVGLQGALEQGMTTIKTALTIDP